MSENKTPTTDELEMSLLGQDMSQSERLEIVYGRMRMMEIKLTTAQKQIEMDTVRIKEMQDSGYRCEAEIVRLREACIASRNSILGYKDTHNLHKDSVLHKALDLCKQSLSTPSQGETNR